MKFFGKLRLRIADWIDPFEAVKRQIRNERHRRKAIAFAWMYGAGIDPETRRSAARWIEEAGIVNGFPAEPVLLRSLRREGVTTVDSKAERS